MTTATTLETQPQQTSETQTMEMKAIAAIPPLAAALCDGAAPLAARFRALFSLRGAAAAGPSAAAAAAAAAAPAFNDASVLLKHEVAYVLGQMRCAAAVPLLAEVLGDTTQDPMVRHEAAEALGAIADPSAIAILEPFLHDPEIVVRETTVLAIERIRFECTKAAAHPNKDDTEDDEDPSPYASVDPAPATARSAALSTDHLRSVLLDQSRPLFERYRAMFALRNRGAVPDVLALADGLISDPSALFRHEVAYVFGQMQHPASVPSLIKSLSNTSEAPMVRHEAAEALGSIASPECFPVLRAFANDPEPVVRESCIVGLDMYNHETSSEFQYASHVIDQQS